MVEEGGRDEYEGVGVGGGHNKTDCHSRVAGLKEYGCTDKEYGREESVRR